MDPKPADPSLRWYAKREPAVLIVLSTVAILGVLGVSALSEIYRSQQRNLAALWFARAEDDERSGNLVRAVDELQAAEIYARDNFTYQLALAQMLAALGRTGEAYSYLLNLRERQPDNGTVNLELARVLAKRGNTEAAIRYYHNAIYAVWSDREENQRNAARLELIEFLLHQNLRTQAQSELIALAGNLPPDPQQRAQAGRLFLEAGDDEHALAEFQSALNIDRHNQIALAGAGRAAFELGHYAPARRYLQAAVEENHSDQASADLLKIAELVEEMDPFRPGTSISQRIKSVLESFSAAGDRIQSCSAATGSTSTAGPSDLEDQYNTLKPQITAAGLRRNPDLLDAAMNLVFSIEHQTAASCGPPADKDEALLLVSKLHEGAER
jgi:thioredoxin-like negative regulator of GroEL